jgi:DNA-binding response OmpR family regulator
MRNIRGIKHLSSDQGEPSSARRSLRILIADDERDIVLTMMMLMRDEGHEVRGVYTGRQVLDAILGFDPQVLILDIALPDLSGWEVARQVRARPDGARPMVIGITGQYTYGADRILSEIIGFDHYLIKPCDPGALIALLEPLRLPGGER